jgi:hypothetical protein
MTNLTKERIEQIEFAINLINEAKANIEDALHGTGLDHHFEAYGRYGIDQLLNDGNPHDSGLYDLIRELRETVNE